MPALREPIDDVLSLPLSGADRIFLRGAASIVGKSLDAFVRDAALEAARQAEADHEVLTRGRSARPVGDLDHGTVDAIRRSHVPDEHKRLDDLVEDWNP